MINIQYYQYKKTKKQKKQKATTAKQQQQQQQQQKSSTEVEKVINSLSIVKACQNDIRTERIKMNEIIFACFIAEDFNNCVDKGVFRGFHEKKVIM